MPDLSHLSRTRLPIGGIADLMLQAREALAEAGSLWIVHHDVKPSARVQSTNNLSNVLLHIWMWLVVAAAKEARASPPRDVCT